MSMDQPRRPTRTPGGPASRPPRAASPAIAVVVALLAAVLGFVILKSLDSDNDSSVSTNGDGSDQTSDSAAETTIDPALTTVATTIPAVDKQSFKLLVANASQVKGSAANLTSQLQALGYQTLEPTNAIDATTALATTVVYFVPNTDAAGNDVAAAIGKAAAPMPATLPVAQAAFEGGTVLIMLGTDLAGQTIPGGAGATTATVAPAASPNETTTTAG